MAAVLVIEDNATNLKLATLLLTRAGHTVLAAADAETGLTLAHLEKPELILMDIQLPGMDGLAATALLKQDPATAGIPVIALTAMAMKADQDRSRLAGCDGYITKPLRYQELYAAIDTLLVNRRVEAAGQQPEPHHVPSLFVREETTVDSPARGPGPPPVDVSMLESLVGSDPVVILDFLTDFRASAQLIGTALLAACRSADAVTVGAQAHKLKSSARSVGAQALGDLCERLEAAAKAGRLDTLGVLCPVFERDLHLVLAYLDARTAVPPAVTA
ncbi:response regulator [Cryobacterium melibiosiphilum]|uniref:Response regulator n=1 Tax=Cryobacterium melibiosiphilum TaxID=995039 RepID=A0A3A5MA88_9MICO|nr:response regulator [Cryobacterium melibiosiphilum]RJT84753.1 response regulator [Cryobacterium melibiosiphilum]